MKRQATSHVRLRERCLAFALAFLAQVAAAQPLEFNVATYNLRFDTPQDGPNAWPQRRDMVKALVRYHGFDIFGTQEGLAHQLADLDDLRAYARVGVGRDDGKEGGEFVAIFYRKDRFDAVRRGDFWLSETPDRPSRGWDGKCCNRIVSWVELRDARSGKSFFVFSAHFDHEGIVARRESAKLLTRKIVEIAGDRPVVCVGDFNTTPDTEPIAIMRQALRDAREASKAPPYGPIGTFNEFRLDAPLERRIDYIFVSRHIEVLRYAALTDSLDRRYPSDHLPVVARIRID
jgi:endonuclease/exonuclease/phosphatase family metal-dependent hydrolase